MTPQEILDNAVAGAKNAIENCDNLSTIWWRGYLFGVAEALNHEVSLDEADKVVQKLYEIEGN